MIAALCECGRYLEYFTVSVRSARRKWRRKKDQWRPVAQRAAGYQRTNLVAGGVIPVATSPGLYVVVVPVTEDDPDGFAVLPAALNFVPRYAPGLPMA
jgi:hypothetical protein